MEAAFVASSAHFLQWLDCMSLMAVVSAYALLSFGTLLQCCLRNHIYCIYIYVVASRSFKPAWSLHDFCEVSWSWVLGTFLLDWVALFMWKKEPINRVCQHDARKSHPCMFLNTVQERAMAPVTTRVSQHCARKSPLWSLSFCSHTMHVKKLFLMCHTIKGNSCFVEGTTAFSQSCYTCNTATDSRPTPVWLSAAWPVPSASCSFGYNGMGHHKRLFKSCPSNTLGATAVFVFYSTLWAQWIWVPVKKLLVVMAGFGSISHHRGPDSRRWWPELELRPAVLTGSVSWRDTVAVGLILKGCKCRIAGHMMSYLFAGYVFFLSFFFLWEFKMFQMCNIKNHEKRSHRNH